MFGSTSTTDIPCSFEDLNTSMRPQVNLSLHSVSQTSMNTGSRLIQEHIILFERSINKKALESTHNFEAIDNGTKHLDAMASIYFIFIELNGLPNILQYFCPIATRSVSSNN